MVKKFYEFNQNNSGGSFCVDNKVCHRLFIEANDDLEANNIAESLGVYFNGVNKGYDCSCCGDRWSEAWNYVNLDKYNQEGYSASVYDHYNNTKDTEFLWEKKYNKYNIVKNPKWEKGYFLNSYTGKISFRNIEEYAQFLADEYGWTSPDARIFYKDGIVKEIFTNKDNDE